MSCSHATDRGRRAALIQARIIPARLLSSARSAGEYARLGRGRPRMLSRSQTS
jgi:hypothetical protein